jgi:hypothetical protein
MPAFSMRTLFGATIAAPARDNIKDLRNDIISVSQNRKKFYEKHMINQKMLL